MLKKRSHDFKLFIEACLLVENKTHTPYGSEENQNKIKQLSLQLSSKLEVLEKNKLETNTNVKLNNRRITGFVDAEGSFSFTVVSNSKNKSNPKYKGVNFVFSITQEKSETEFLHNLSRRGEFFGCGNVFTDNRGRGQFYVNNKKDLFNKIIPFFEENELQTIKKYSFLKFKKALDICINNKPLLPNHIEELEFLLKDKTGKRPKK